MKEKKEEKKEEKKIFSTLIVLYSVPSKLPKPKDSLLSQGIAIHHLLPQHPAYITTVSMPYLHTYSKTMQHVEKDHYTLPSQNLARTITAQSQQDDGENAKQEDGHPR